jgi:hypothetical protein
MAVAGEIKGRGRRWQGLCPRPTPLTSTPTANDKGKRVEGDLLGPERILAGHFPPLGWFLKRRKNRERDRVIARLGCPKFEFEFEST